MDARATLWDTMALSATLFQSARYRGVGQAKRRLSGSPPPLRGSFPAFVAISITLAIPPPSPRHFSIPLRAVCCGL